MDVKTHRIRAVYLVNQIEFGKDMRGENSYKKRCRRNRLGAKKN